MGVQTRIALYANKESSAVEAAAEAFSVIGALEAVMSDYRPDSELSQLTHRAVHESVTVSSDLFKVLALSQQLAQQSGGAFDITVGPLVSQWREARRTGILPTDADRAKARARVGWRLLELDHDSRTVKLLAPDMKLDLGGVAKGYAAQRAVDHLRATGFPSCLVALAGDVVVGDPPPGSAGWVINVPTPLEEAAHRRIILENAAVSTSGDTEQFVEIAGIRYSHIIDPRTGLGVTDPRTVTVVAPNGESADALSTALCVLGPDSMRQLIDEYPDTAVIMMVKGGRNLIQDPHSRIRWKSASRR